MPTPADLPFRIRQSTLEDARCLYRFHQTHVLGLRDPESEAAGRGTQVHEMAKKYVDYLVNSKQELDWSYAESLIVAGNWGQEACTIFKDWSNRRTFEPASIYATEYQVRLGWDFLPCDDDIAVFSMDIDRLEIHRQDAHIVDYKTHFGTFEPTTIQAVYYPWLLWKIMPWLENISFTLDFVRWGILKTRQFTRDDLKRMDVFVDNQVARLSAAVTTDEWPASVNSKCAYCRLECPLVEQGLTRESIGQIQSPEHARSIAQQAYALRRAYTQAHAMLRAYALENGPIDAGNDIKMGFTKHGRDEYDPQSIFRLNEKYGFAKLRGLKVVSKEIGKIGREYPEYVEEARKSARDKSRTVFKFWNDIGDPLGEEEDD